MIKINNISNNIPNKITAKKINPKFFIAIFCFLALYSTNFAIANISGVVYDKSDNSPISGIKVQIKNDKSKTFTNQKGEFRIETKNEKVVLLFSSLLWKDLEISTDNNTSDLKVFMDAATINSNEVLVYGASRRKEKITQAPAAVSVVQLKDIEKAVSHGQIARTLDKFPGVDVVQSGMNDFNVNMRGFNNSINRRVLVLVDGRDPSTPLLNLVEWNSLQSNLGDVNNIEVVRGPGSALYGINAYNGVINITTSAPQDIQGTKVSTTLGEFNLFRGDIRNAGKISDNLFYKANVGYSRQDQPWVSSRDTRATYIRDANGVIIDSTFGSLEYSGLAPDVKGNRAGFGNIQNIDSLIKENDTATNLFATGRLDYILDEENTTLVTEMGYSRYGGEYFVNQTGRILIPDVEKPFARIALNSDNFNVQAHWNRRNTIAPQVVMNAPASSAERSDVYVVDAQWNEAYFDNTFKVILGASHEYHDVNTSIIGALPLLSPDGLHNNFSGVYSQLEYDVLSNLKFVGAARFDRSTFFENQFSPKLAVVWTPIENHTFRGTINRSFLRPSYGDKFRRSPAGAPITIGLIDSAIAQQFGVERITNSNTVSSWNLGNPNVNVESAVSYEIGYKGIINKDLFITVDAYVNRRQNFISNPLGSLAPNVYSNINYKNADGSINQEANDTLRNRLRSINPLLFDRLAIDPVTGNVASIVTVTNIGLVTEYGLEFGANYYISDELLFNASYSYLDVKIEDNTLQSGNNTIINKILPNTSRHRMNFGATYEEKNASTPWDIGMNVRGVQKFNWIAGTVEGIVPEYWVVDLNANVKISESVKIGLNVFNLLDRRHYQIFGGTFLQRNASLRLGYDF